MRGRVRKNCPGWQRGVGWTVREEWDKNRRIRR